MIRTTRTCVLATCALLLGATATRAATSDQTCLKGRYTAAARYASCQRNAVAKLYGGGEIIKYELTLAKCRLKYASVWPKLQAKTPGSTCDIARFTDNGTTVTDNLSGLQWEKKTDDATIHDQDDTYAWCLDANADFDCDGPTGPADGPVFTTFLSTLNGSGCFAGQCDWRLPTILELQTILLGPFPCTSSPCIESVFGPTVGNVHWSAIEAPFDFPGSGVVDFSDGGTGFVGRSSHGYVRAVRGGL